MVGTSLPGAIGRLAREDVDGGGGREWTNDDVGASTGD